MLSTKWLVNAVIVLALALQVIPTISSWRFYPFIDYPMYSDRGRPQPIEMPKSTVTLVAESGEREHFLPESGQELSRGVSVLGLSQTVYFQKYLYPMAVDCDSERAADAAADLGLRLNKYAEDPVISIEIDTIMYRLDNHEITVAETNLCEYEILSTTP